MPLRSKSKSAPAVLLAVALGTSSVSAATPLDDLVVPPLDGKSACFKRVYDAAHLKAHPKQKTVEMKAWLLYRKEKTADPPTVDLGLAINQRGDAQPVFGSGNCYWDEGVNRDVQDRPLIKNFKKTVGLTCMMLAQPDVFNVSSAEEGGLVILDPGKDKDTLMVYLDAGLSMVKRANRAKHSYAEFGSEDRVFMLRRTDTKDCAAVEDAVTTPEPEAPRR